MAVVCACGQPARPGDVECSLCGRELAPHVRTEPAPPASSSVHLRTPAAGPGPSTRPVVIVAGVLLLVVALGLLTLLLVRPAAGGSSGGPAAGGQADTSTTAPASDDSSTTSPPPDTPVPAEPTDTQTSEPVVLPDGAVQCPQRLDDPAARLQHSARGNDVTTCPFAENVRKEYLDQDVDGTQIEVRAYSPVTKKTYRMTCRGTTLVRCTGGENALVLVY